MKAADISDGVMLRVIASPNASHRAGRLSSDAPNWWMRWDLDKQFSAFPSKVVLAKCRQLMKRGLINGCDCGCRGDFEITDKGREYLAGLEPLHFPVVGGALAAQIADVGRAIDAVAVPRAGAVVATGVSDLPIVAVTETRSFVLTGDTAKEPPPTEAELEALRPLVDKAVRDAIDRAWLGTILAPAIIPYEASLVRPYRFNWWRWP